MLDIVASSSGFPAYEALVTSLCCSWSLMCSSCGHDDKFHVGNTCLLELGTTVGQVLVLSMCQCYVGLSNENSHTHSAVR